MIDKIVFVLLFAGVIMILFLVALVMFARIFGPWLQAFLAGVHVSLLQIVGMRFRRTDVRAVVRALIMATQARTPVPCIEMEQAYLQGVDVEKATLAFIQANRDGKQVTFQEIVEAEMDGRLKEKLGR
jgi:uncharacterized protein YqfA (UPF0365 family)